MANHSTYILALVASMFTTTAIADDGYVKTDDPWFIDGKAALNERLAQKQNTNKAKNVILFVGDGMGISTITAARIYDGQTRGETGEENSLSFDAFPHSGLVKVYNVDAQIPGSGATASALNTGVKTRIGTLGTHADVPRGDCRAHLKGQPTNLAELARLKNKSIGVVSTSQIIDATPAAVYAHTPERYWYYDLVVPSEARELGCKDTPIQLLEFGPNVAFGGGRNYFYSQNTPDPEEKQNIGKRGDGRNLISEWLGKYPNSKFIWDQKGFDDIDPKNSDHILGLFSPEKMSYEADRKNDIAGEPSLSEMTKSAIEILSNNNDGYFLMVEGARIDHAHHAGNAYRALNDTQEFSRAVAEAINMVDLDNTLIIVTADHSHTFTLSGAYAARGNDIFGLARWKTLEEEGDGELILDNKGKPYTTLGYRSGPGAFDGERPLLSEEDATDHNHLQQALIPKNLQEHTGEDVAVYAIGPWAHLVAGTMEQNVIYHIMKHAMGLKEE
jgi:alkaline phosphatase